MRALRHARRAAGIIAVLAAVLATGCGDDGAAPSGGDTAAPDTAGGGGGQDVEETSSGGGGEVDSGGEPAGPEPCGQHADCVGKVDGLGPCEFAGCIGGTCKAADVDDGVSCTLDDPCVEDTVCDDGACGGTPRDCDDGDPCTVNSCDADEGGCVADPDGADGTPCEDQDACTTSDVCAAGACGGEAVVCEGPNPCVLYACDQATGACGSETPAPAGTECDDGDDSCTESDGCDGTGLCAGEPVDCDDEEVCTVDGCLLGVGCQHDALAQEGAECDDGEACTQGDLCQSGSCAGAAVSCSDGDPCTSDSCDAETGDCEFDAVGANGLPCDDGEVCTSDDECLLGACAGAPTVCDDGNLCTLDSCEPGLGCTVDADALDGASCEDGDPCTEADDCFAGGCAGVPRDCADLDSCTVDACDPFSGDCVHDSGPLEGLACEDGNPCTGGETCQAGVCLGGGEACDDGNPCTKDSCELATGTCVHNVAASNGFPCDDGDACTATTFCSAGACVGPVKSCEDGNPCTDDSCDADSGACVHDTDAVAGLPCLGGNLCESNTVCFDGACTGDAVDCDDDNACTFDLCNPGTGTCIHNGAPEDGLECNDGDPCTAGEFCLDGDCQGFAVICEDGNPCTADSCDSNTGGCVQDPVPLDGLPCDDAEPCTDDGLCFEGSCEASLVRCEDDNACTQDFCDAVTGECLFLPLDEVLECDDDNPCTAGDACDDAGGCSGTPISFALPCDDGNPCTDSVCEADTGSCLGEPVEPGLPCDDGDECTTASICDEVAACVGEQAVCEDDEPCTENLCDPEAGCFFEPLAPGAPCQGEAGCYLDPVCTEDGECIGNWDVESCQCASDDDCADYDDVCHAGVCDLESGSCSAEVALGESCDDGFACSHSDACDESGICTGEAYACDDSDCLLAECLGNGQCGFQQAEDSCLVGFDCYEPGEGNPQNPCELCIPALDESGFTPPLNAQGTPTTTCVESGAWQSLARPITHTPHGHPVVVVANNTFSDSGASAASVAAVFAAITAGADAVELDVREDDEGDIRVETNDLSPGSGPHLSDVLGGTSLSSSDVVVFIDVREDTPTDVFVSNLLDTLAPYAGPGRPVVLRAFDHDARREALVLARDLLTSPDYATLAPFVRLHCMFASTIGTSLVAAHTAIDACAVDGFHGVELDVSTGSLFGLLSHARLLGLTTVVRTITAASGPQVVAGLREHVDAVIADWEPARVKSVIEDASAQLFIDVHDSAVAQQISWQLNATSTATIELGPGVPTLTTPTGAGEPLYGTSMAFEPTASQHIPLGLTPATAPDGGLLVSAAIQLDFLEGIGDGDRRAIVGNEALAGMFLDVHNDGGERLLRFGLWIDEAPRVVSYSLGSGPFALSPFESAFIVAAWDGHGPLELWVDGVLVAAQPLDLAPGAPGLYTDSGLDLVLGALPDPFVPEPGAVQSPFDGRIQHLQVVGWRPHECFVDGDCVHLDSGCFDGYCSAGLCRTEIRDDWCTIGESQCFAPGSSHPSEDCVTCTLLGGDADWTAVGAPCVGSGPYRGALRPLLETIHGNTVAMTCEDCYREDGTTEVANAANTLSLIHAAQLGGADIISLDVNRDGGILRLAGAGFVSPVAGRLADVLADSMLANGDQLLVIESKIGDPQPDDAAALIDVLLASGWGTPGRPVVLSAFHERREVLTHARDLLAASIYDELRAGFLFEERFKDTDGGASIVQERVEQAAADGIDIVRLHIGQPSLFAVVDYARALGLGVGVHGLDAEAASELLTALREDFDDISVAPPAGLGGNTAAWFGTLRATLDEPSTRLRFDTSTLPATATSMFFRDATGQAHVVPLTGSQRPFLVDPGPGESLFARALDFNPAAGDLLPTGVIGTVPGAGVLVAFNIALDEVQLPEGARRTLLSTGATGGFEVDLRNPSGAEDPTQLRFGVRVGGVAHHAVVAASHLSTTSSHLVVGAWDGAGPVRLWIDGESASDLDPTAVEPVVTGGLDDAEHPLVVGAQPLDLATGEAEWHVDGRLQHLHVAAWGVHGCSSDADCSGLDSLCWTGLCELGSGLCVRELAEQGCAIGDVCYPPDASHDEDSCLRCDPAQSPQDWTDVAAGQCVATGYWTGIGRALPATPHGNVTAIGCVGCETLGAIHAALDAGADVIDLPVVFDGVVPVVTNGSELATMLQDPTLAAHDGMLSVTVADAPDDPQAAMSGLLNLLLAEGYARAGAPVILRAGSDERDALLAARDLDAPFVRLHEVFEAEQVPDVSTFQLDLVEQTAADGLHAAEFAPDDSNLFGKLNWARSLGLAVGLSPIAADAAAIVTSTLRDDVDVLWVEGDIATSHAVALETNARVYLHPWAAASAGAVTYQLDGATEYTAELVAGAPSLESWGQGQDLFGSWLDFVRAEGPPVSGDVLDLGPADAGPGEGVIVSLVANFDHFGIDDLAPGDRRVLLSDGGDDAGFFMDLARGPVGDDERWLRFGVRVATQPASWAIARYPLSAINGNDSYYIVGAYDRDADEVRLWVNASSVDSEPADASADVVPSGLAVRVGGMANPDATGTHYADAKVQRVTVGTWGVHACKSDADCPDANCGSGICDSGSGLCSVLPAPGWCWATGVCAAFGWSHPTDGCLFCDPFADKLGWTARDDLGGLCDPAQDTQLTFIVQTADVPGAGSHDTFEACVSEDRCWTLDQFEADYVAAAAHHPDDLTRDAYDHYTFDTDLTLSDLTSLMLQPAGDQANDAWSPRCLAMLVDGELAYCRDDFQDGAAVVTLGTGFGATPAWADDDPFSKGCGGCYASRLSHGPMVGHTTTTSTTIWLRTERSLPVVLRWWPEGSPEAVQATDAATPQGADDFTLHTVLDGLSPSTTYVYEIDVAGQLSKSGLTFTTAPVGSGVFRVAFGAHTRWSLDSQEPIWDVVAGHEPDLLLLVGDAHQADSTEIAKQAYHFQRELTVPGFAELVATTPTLAVWDDEDFGGPGSYGTSLPGTADALAAFRRYRANPSYGSADADDGIWSSAMWGGVEIFLLDGRSQRDDPGLVTDGALLGDAQLQWLQQRLANSTATFKVLVGASRWSLSAPGDSYATSPTERRALFQYLVDHSIGGVMMLSNDGWLSEFRQLDVDAAGQPISEGSSGHTPAAYPLYEFAVSPFQGLVADCPPTDGGPDQQLFCAGADHYFGLAEFDTTAQIPTVTVQIRSSSDDLVGEWTIELTQLLPTP